MATLPRASAGERPTFDDESGAHRVHLTAMGHEGLPSPLRLVPGRVVGLTGRAGTGLTRLGLQMLAAHGGSGPLVYVDVRGWLCPSAAWEVGIEPESLVVARSRDPVTWTRVVSTLLEGVGAVFAEVPRGVKGPKLRTLAALARRHHLPLLLRPLSGELPSGVAHLALTAHQVAWFGADPTGHGRLGHRRIVVEATGKAVQGRRVRIEVEDHGAHALRVVSGLASAPSGRAVG